MMKIRTKILFIMMLSLILLGCAPTDSVETCSDIYDGHSIHNWGTGWMNIYGFQQTATEVSIVGESFIGNRQCSCVGSGCQFFCSTPNSCNSDLEIRVCNMTSHKVAVAELDVNPCGVFWSTTAQLVPGANLIKVEIRNSQGWASRVLTFTP